MDNFIRVYNTLYDVYDLKPREMRILAYLIYTVRISDSTFGTVYIDEMSYRIEYNKDWYDNRETISEEIMNLVKKGFIEVKCFYGEKEKGNKNNRKVKYAENAKDIIGSYFIEARLLFDMKREQDKENNFSPIPKHLLFELSDNQFTVYAYVYKTRNIKISRNNIVEYTHMSLPTVKRTIRELEDMGYLTKILGDKYKTDGGWRQEVNRYIVHKTPVKDKVDDELEKAVELLSKYDRYMYDRWKARDTILDKEDVHWMWELPAGVIKDFVVGRHEYLLENEATSEGYRKVVEEAELELYNEEDEEEDDDFEEESKEEVATETTKQKEVVNIVLVDGTTCRLTDDNIDSVDFSKMCEWNLFKFKIEREQIFNEKLFDSEQIANIANYIKELVKEKWYFGRMEIYKVNDKILELYGVDVEKEWKKQQEELSKEEEENSIFN